MEHQLLLLEISRSVAFQFQACNKLSLCHCLSFSLSLAPCTGWSLELELTESEHRFVG